MCDCKPVDEVCEHVVACILCLRQAEAEGRSLAVTKSVEGSVQYVLIRSGGGLGLQRHVLIAGDMVVVRGALLSFARRRDVAITAGPTDLALERHLGTREWDWIPPGQMKGTLKLLSRLPEVMFEGRTVSMSLRPKSAVAVVSDHPSGFLLKVEQDSAIDEVFNNSTVRCGDTFHPLGEIGLSASELKKFRPGYVFRKAEFAELVGSILPSLRPRITVSVQTLKLPELVDEIARLEVDVQVDGHEILVRPSVVYGEPAIAKVIGGRLEANSHLIPKRDEDREFRLLRRMRQELALEPDRDTRMSGESAVLFVERLRRWDGRVVGEPLGNFEVHGALRPQVEFSETALPGFLGTLSVDFTVESGPKRSANPSVVLSAWKAGETLVPLLGGGWATLPADWLRRCGQVTLDLLNARDSQGRIPTSAVHDASALCEHSGVQVPANLSSLRAAIETFEKVPEADLPSDLTATLREYQRVGVNWLRFMGSHGLGALLADDMGLGKTLQALCVIEGRSLVVVPTSVMSNWAREAAVFRPSLKVAIYHGPRRRLDPEADITLTTYALLRIDSDMLAAEPWGTIVLDEAQAIKNPSSQVSRAARRLTSSLKIALTGTPVENRLDELWSQFDFLAPGLLGTRESFSEQYVRPILGGVPGVAERLRQRIRPFVLRRLKRDVAPELPPRTDATLHCELSPREREVYDAIRIATRKDVVERLKAGGSVMEALEALLRLRQAACHTALLPGQEAEGSAKLTLLMRTLVELREGAHKSLVFSQWTGLLDLVEPFLEKEGISYVRLDGSTRDRAAVVDSFQLDSSVNVMLLSLKAGGTGLNLTAADHVFLLDPWWNPAVEEQAADRAHRIGQERPVFVHRLVSLNTVEEQILQLQRKKRELAEAALGEGGRVSQGLSRDDLLSLLSDTP
jgi:hypothetical protein